MRRDITSWYSHRLQQEMPLVAYGHYGPPVLMLPTAAADFLEYERFHMIDSVKWFLDNGKAKIYSVNSVNRQALILIDPEYSEPQDRNHHEPAALYGEIDDSVDHAPPPAAGETS